MSAPSNARIPNAKTAGIWLAVVIGLALPIGIAASSPLLETRDPIYIIAGLAGVIAMAVLLLQPMFVGHMLPGISRLQSRRMHRWLGLLLSSLVVLHVVGLWIFSPPDVIDALLLRSPTPFSLWGVIALWAVFGSALMALLRRRIRLPMRIWRVVHSILALVIVFCTILHAWFIEGSMGTMSKTVLSAAVGGVTAWVVYHANANYLHVANRKT